MGGRVARHGGRVRLLWPRHPVHGLGGSRARRRQADRGPLLSGTSQSPARRSAKTAGGTMSDHSVAIVTDSTADLPPDLTRSRSIVVVPLTLHFEGKSLLDGIEITPGEFYRSLPSATTHPTTSQPSAGRFAETYAELLKEHEAVVSIHISEKLSGTYESARQGADLTDPKRVHVIDSQVVSMSVGLVTLAASQLASQGADARSIANQVLSMRDLVQTYFSVATLEFLRRGGRIGRANALLGSV
ncbi:MAG: DegV family protein [Chloroflexi bacterium]|nr:MAG: DegV family protein [Chloroflexota bacterium]